MLNFTEELHTRPYMVSETKHFHWVISCFISQLSFSDINDKKFKSVAYEWSVKCLDFRISSQVACIDSAWLYLLMIFACVAPKQCQTNIHRSSYWFLYFTRNLPGNYVLGWIQSEHSGNFHATGECRHTLFHIDLKLTSIRLYLQIWFDRNMSSLWCAKWTKAALDSDLGLQLIVVVKVEWSQ